MIGQNRGKAIKPKEGELGEDFAFARNAVGHDAIEGGDSIGGHEEKAVTEVEHLADLAAFHFCNAGQVDLKERFSQHNETVRRCERILKSKSHSCAGLTHGAYPTRLSSMLFGAHMSTGGGVWKALERGAGIGCETVQHFVKNNMQWFGKPQGPNDLKLYAQELATKRIKFVFGHTGYLINLGAPTSDNREKSLKSLLQEIEFATALGLPFLVLHPGAHLGGGEAAGIKLIVEGLNEVLQATKSSPVRIALENTAGQGSCLGNEVRHLAVIFDTVKKPDRLAVCLDTAHFFAAGYDIRSPKG